jgi:hypothetical protein
MNRKNTVNPLCVVMVTTVFVTGCVTDPRTGQSMFDPRAAAAIGGTVLGVAGGFAGGAIGGNAGAAIGAAIGVGIGGLAGYFITDYLNEQERQEYLANLTQQMKVTPDNIRGSNDWSNMGQTKHIKTDYSSAILLRQVAFHPSNNIQLNKQRIASLPQNTICREAKSQIQVQGQRADMLGVYCRDANGDYIKVDGTDI